MRLFTPKCWNVLRTAYITHYDNKGFLYPMSFNPNQFADPVQAYAFIPFGGTGLCAVHLQNTLSYELSYLCLIFNSLVWGL
ncbi:putative cytochrome P450 superfamily [Helianthus debilis subsp. tardiflorus]